MRVEQGRLSLVATITACVAAGCQASPGLTDARVGFDVGSVVDAALDSPFALADDISQRPRIESPQCIGAPDEAAIPDGTGGHVCTYVGANREFASTQWPTLRDEPTPRTYVRAGASPGGDGSESRPFASIGMALTTVPGTRTLVLGAGRYELISAIELNGPLQIIGTGAGGALSSGGGGADAGFDAGVADATSDTGLDAGTTPDAAFDDAVDEAIDAASDAGTDSSLPALAGTTIVPATNAAAIEITGSAASVTITRLEIAGDRSPMSAGVRITGGGRLVLEHVSITSVGAGLEVRNAALRAQGLTVSECGRDGVALTEGSSGSISSFNIRGNTGYGLLARASSLSASEGMLVGNGAGGLVLVGPSPGDTDRIDRLVARSNAIVGIAADNPLPTAPPRSVEITLTSVTNTLSTSVAQSGYGVFIGSGIDAHFDRLITTDARRGHGSEFILNAGAGMVVSGARTTLDLHGARLSGNDGPGLMLQRGASASLVGYSEFVANLGTGVMLTSGASLAYFVCNESSQSALGPIVFTTRSARFGDGLLAAPGGAMPPLMSLAGNLLNDNDRFGAYFAGATIMVGANTADRNRAGAGVTDATTMVTGMAGFFARNANVPAGTDLPLATDALADLAVR